MSGHTEDEHAVKATHHFGRGGAGNTTIKKAQSPAMEPVTTPTLKSKMYTTGRGGTGNMARNDMGQEARAAQDVDIPGITLPEHSHHTGRGGAANTYSPSDAERLEARSHNEKLRTSSFKSNSSSKERGGIKGLAEKAKEVLKGDKKSHDDAVS